MVNKHTPTIATTASSKTTNRDYQNILSRGITLLIQAVIAIQDSIVHIRTHYITGQLLIPYVKLGQLY